MGLTDVLMASGYQPEANTDEAFETLTGQYRCHCSQLRSEPADQRHSERWAAQYLIDEVIDGTVVDTTVSNEKRRRFFKSYSKTEDAQGLKSMLNDLFTMGVTLDTSSDKALEASLINAIGKEAFIRSWGWTPKTARDGTPIPEAEWRTLQQFVIKRKTDVRVRKPSSTVPAF